MPILPGPLATRPRSRPRSAIPAALCALLLCALAACKLISDYDALSYKNAIDLRVETMALLDQGAEPYKEHAAEVAALRLRIAQAHEYEQRKGKLNAESARQWAVLDDREGALQRTFDLWKSAGTLNAEFVAEARRKAGELYDEIIRLERAKAE